MSTTNRPLLSVCMIVRNSERTLPACLESIRPWVGEMVIVDTGSLDRTREIAQAFGARLFDFPWVDDFSAARNESFRLATGEWIFWMDSDDTIDAANGEQLLALAKGVHDPNVLGYVVQVHCPHGPNNDSDNLTVVDHVKLVRNHPDIRFEGRIHEQLLPAIHRLGGQVRWTDLFVVHSGADHSETGKRQKYERDLHHLRLDLQDRPDHPFVLFNLGMTYADMGDHAVAERWLRCCLKVSRVQESHVRKAYALLVSCLKELRRYQEAREVCAQGLAAFPQDVELLFRHGILAHESGELDEAIADYRATLKSREERHFTSVDTGLFSYKTQNNLALVYADGGHHALAEIQWRSIVETHPHFRGAWRGLGQSLLRQQKSAALDLLLDELDTQTHGQADACWLRAQAAEQRGDVHHARPLLNAALGLDPNHEPARQDYCRWLFQYGPIDEAEAALRDLTLRAPKDGAAFHNLGLVYVRMGQIALAIQSFEQSLRVRPDSPATLAELQGLQSRINDHVASQVQASRGGLEDVPVAPSTILGRYGVSQEQNGFQRPLDIVYLFCHSPHDDLEIMYSLRSVAKHLPYIRKVWIFGDRPKFLSDDTSIVEHVPHEVLAQPLGFRVPVRNEFLMLFLASLIPDLAFDFVKFADDYIVLQTVSRDRLCIFRALEDLNQIAVRGRGVFKDLVWLTYDTLKRAGYPGYNFQGHVPQPYTRQLVLDAFRTFRDFVSEERFFGLISETSICNFGLKHRKMPFVWLEQEKSKAGFYKSSPQVEEIDSACTDKLFLNFSDKAFGEPMVRFLQARFSHRCKYECLNEVPPTSDDKEWLNSKV